MKNLRIYIGVKGAGYSIELDKDLLPVPSRLAQVPLIDLLKIGIDNLSRELRGKVKALGVLGNVAEANGEGEISHEKTEEHPI